jgi:hypothetical protein
MHAAIVAYNGRVATRKQERRERKRRVHGLESSEYSQPVTSKPERERPARGRARTYGQVTMNPDGSFLMGRRKVYPPTWRRAVKRALLFLPFGFVLGLFMVKNNTATTAVLLAAVYTLAAVPITYWTDRMSYRRLERKFEDAGGTLP